jgi:membrane-bound lytic murein transglycosylase A
MNTSSASASRASSKSKTMERFSWGLRTSWIITSAVALVSCTSVQVQAPPVPQPPITPAVGPPITPVVAAPDAPSPATPTTSAEVLVRAKSRWVPVAWSELPGWSQEQLSEAWPAKVRSCLRPHPAFAPLCPEIRQLATADPEAQRRWMMQRLRPYRVLEAGSASEGLLTSYFEPILTARRQASASHRVPLYRPPADLASRRPWFTRQEIETSPQAREALRGREIAWLSDPIDAMLLHIQGSGRLLVTEPDGFVRQVRVAFAGSNEQPYRSINQWLLEQGVQRINPWPEATKAWAAQNPQRVSQLLWSNPRYVFFREEVITNEAEGPRGAQGVPLSAGRSIAVDPGSIPYGTPVWLVSGGPAVRLQRLVQAQDTGSAIVGAVRADYFAGTGSEAGQLASKVKQPLQMWALWPLTAR